MTRILFATAVALFVLSLPIHMTALGATLRRWAGVSFVAALLPSLIGGLFFPTAKLSFAERPIMTAVTLGLGIAVAYAAYAIRKWLRDDPAKKQQRLPEKTPIERSRRQQDLFALLADNQSPDGPRS